MGAFEIRGYAKSSAAKLPDQLEVIASALRADGWRVQSYSVTSDDVPDWRQFYFPFVIRGVQKAGATKGQAEAAMQKASGSLWNAMKDVAASAVQEVVVQSAKDTVAVVQRTAAAAEKAAFGIGTGLGLAVALVGGLYLVSMFRGRA